MSRISESSEFINNPEDSPFSSIIKYCNDNKSVYGHYKRMSDARTQIGYLQDLDVNNIDSANQFIINILNCSDPFLSWIYTSDITPNKFCKSLRIASHYLAQDKFVNSSNPNDEKKMQNTKANLEKFKKSIIEDCPLYYNDLYVFVPIAFFGSYLLDPDNDQLFLEYFNSFTQKYIDFILLKLYLTSDKKISQDEFCKSQKHSETIELLKPLILDHLKTFTLYNQTLENKCEKIVNTIIKGLISQLIYRYRKAYHINYQSFKGSSLDDLLQYETNSLIIYVQKYFEHIKKETLNIFEIKKLQLVFKDVHIQLKDDLKAKFIKLYDSIITSKTNPGKYIQLVYLSCIIDKYNKLFDYNFYDYEDIIYDLAEKNGAELMPFKSNLKEIVNSGKETEKQKVIKAFGDFLQNFLVYEPNNELSEKQHNLIYKFTHGFLKSFYLSWNANLKKISSDIIEECSQKYVICLYEGLKLYSTSKKEVDNSKPLYEKYQPIIFKDEVDISSGYIDNLIDININNSHISELKRICYLDLKKILDTVPLKSTNKQ